MNNFGKGWMMKNLYSDPVIPQYKQEIHNIFQVHGDSAFTDKGWPERAIINFVDELVKTIKRHEEIKMEKYIAKLNWTKLKELHKACKFKQGIKN